MSADSLWKLAPREILTTGIGSLPHTFVDAALNFSLGLSIPFLPQVPVRNPREFMLAQALDGLPGLLDEEPGYAAVDLSKWEKGKAALKSRIESAFRSDGDGDAFESFEPSPEVWTAWRPFLHELEERHIKLAKIQIAGPITCQWALRFTDGTFADKRPDMGTQIFQLVLARAISMCRKLRSLGVQPLIYLDEPGFYGFTAKNPKHALWLQELRLFLQSLSKESAIVGIHCCTNTDWSAVLSLPIDVLSIDTGLSLNILLSQKEPLRKFLERGGRLSLGVVPTGGHSVRTLAYRPDSHFEQLLETLRSHLGDDSMLLDKICSESIYTPACGLALHSIADAEAILADLLEFGELCAQYGRTIADLQN